MIPEVVEHAPGVVHIDGPEAVTVVPPLRFFYALRVPKVLGEGFDFLLGEAVALIGGDAHGRVHREVVQVREDGFLADALHAGEAGERQRIVALEGACQPAFEEIDGFTVIAMGISGHGAFQALEKVDRGCPLQPVERKANDRVGTVVLAIAAVVGVPDAQPLEKGRGVDAERVVGKSLFKEALEHGEVERFAEPARSAEQRNG